MQSIMTSETDSYKEASNRLHRSRSDCGIVWRERKKQIESGTLETTAATHENNTLKVSAVDFNMLETDAHDSSV